MPREVKVETPHWSLCENTCNRYASIVLSIVCGMVYLCTAMNDNFDRVMLVTFSLRVSVPKIQKKLKKYPAPG